MLGVWLIWGVEFLKCGVHRRMVVFLVGVEVVLDINAGVGVEIYFTYSTIYRIAHGL